MTEIVNTQEVLVLRDQLMALVQDDTAAYSIASVFVADNPTKLALFTRHWHRCAQHQQPDQRAAATVDVAEPRWTEINV